MRASEARRAYISLRVPYGVELGADGRCALDRVVLPSKVGWRTALRPGGFAHIALEEAEATAWCR